MKLTKALATILSLTVLALLYVHQQSKIIQMAYQEQESFSCFENLLDQKNNLTYMINRETSLVAMAKVWQEGDFEWPHRKQFVSLVNVPGPSKTKAYKQSLNNIFASVFRLRSQAEATPVSPR